ncbi:MAG: 2-hydroxy-3-oxopropionate reductase [Christensenellales bacterium]|jgi:2-hydroxy-3-oxopropionate reductase
MNIGFVGLGIMGRPMAINLMKGGHALTVYDIRQESIDALVAQGARGAASAAEAARGAELIITMLPNSPHVKEAVLGENGILETASPGSTWIDMSSITPAASQEIAAACAEKGVKVLEAPVSGGEPKAIDGTVSIMCGGDEAVFEACKPVLELMGKDIVLCGAVGAGNTTKLSNQIIVAVNIAAVAEAFMLAKRAGVDPATVLQAISGGLAGSTVLNAKGKMMIENNINPGFRIDLHIKDLQNVVKTAHLKGAPIPLTALVMEMMQNLRAAGMGQADHSALAKFYEKVAGDTIYDAGETS